MVVKYQPLKWSKMTIEENTELNKILLDEWVRYSESIQYDIRVFNENGEQHLRCIVPGLLILDNLSFFLPGGTYRVRIEHKKQLQWKIMHF